MPHGGLALSLEEQATPKKVAASLTKLGKAVNADQRIASHWRRCVDRIKDANYKSASALLYAVLNGTEILPVAYALAAIDEQVFSSALDGVNLLLFRVADLRKIRRELRNRLGFYEWRVEAFDAILRASSTADPETQVDRGGVVPLHEVQVKMLNALKGKVMSQELLAKSVGCDRTQMRRDYLKPLCDSGHVKYKPGVGCYRPDAPPPEWNSRINNASITHLH